MITVDGHTRSLTTTAATVGDVLSTQGIQVDADDRISQLAAAPIVNGLTITVTRVLRRTMTVRTVLKYQQIEQDDPTLSAGSRKVSTKGVNGLQETSYLVTYLDGKLTSKKIVGIKVITKPVNEVVLVGTQPVECASFPTTGGLSWCGLAKCESGLNPKAVNEAGPYYGLYQFDVGTWQSNGGTGLPSDASVAEQTRVAYNLYQARGAAPWPVCGKYL